VIAATIAILPALRVLEIQEDALRPRPTPYFDMTSRYNLFQLRVKNFGAGVAYDVRLSWKNPPVDYKGNEVRHLDEISILLPQESVSTLVGASSELTKLVGKTRFVGECSYKDASGKVFRENFVCSADGSQKQLIHDSELPKTLNDLQDIPKEHARIAALLESFKSER
jgi:hypothetical protein